MSMSDGVYTPLFLVAMRTTSTNLDHDVYCPSRPSSTLILNVPRPFNTRFERSCKLADSLGGGVNFNSAVGRAQHKDNNNKSLLGSSVVEYVGAMCSSREGM